MNLTYRLTGIFVLTLAAGVAAFGAFGAAPAGAEEPQTYVKYQLDDVQVVGFNPQPEPPVDDCHPSPYISVCDLTSDTGFEPAPPAIPDCNPHPLVNVCDFTIEDDEFQFVPPVLPDCNPHPYINVCDLTSNDGDDWVQMRHQAADSFMANVCKHDTSPDPVSCKPDR